ncbi:MAG: hypothetical protein GY953_44820 [bacterium]|nr:hypothetical protein [bacterium]
MKHAQSRRKFLWGASSGLVASALAPKSAAAPTAAVSEYRRGGMVYRRLGQTDLWLSLLSFGSHTDPADRVRLRPAGTVLTEQGQARRDRMIDRAFDLGVNLLDVYHSEGQVEPSAKLVRGRRDKVLISLAHEINAKSIDNACRLYGHVDLYRFHTADIDGPALHKWDIFRKAKEAGKIRAIGISTHIEHTMVRALEELDGLDYIFFPYNFIYARAEYSEFLPAAIDKGVGLIAMKSLASGSIMELDPRARPGMKPEYDSMKLWTRKKKHILPAAVAQLSKSLDRMPDETLCMAALRFVYSKPFVSTAIVGMFHDLLLDDNYKALTRYQELTSEERAALNAAREVARLHGPGLLPSHYRWLEEKWRVG